MCLYGLQTGLADRNAGRFLTASASALPGGRWRSSCRACSLSLLGSNRLSPVSCQNTLGDFQLIELAAQFFPFGIEPREPFGNPLLLLFHQRSHFSRLSLVRRPSVIRGAGILRCMQMKPTQKRPERQKLLSGRILGDTPDLPTRSVGGHRGIKPFPSSVRVRGADAIAAASNDSSGTLASPNASGIQMPPTRQLFVIFRKVKR
jgi:hypothetical protein